MGKTKTAPRNIEEAMAHLSKIGGDNIWLFVWFFRDIKSATYVFEKLPYMKGSELNLTPRSGTDGWIIHMPNYIHPDGTKGVYALVTGGIISEIEVSQVMKAAKSAGSLVGSFVGKPKESPI